MPEHRSVNTKAKKKYKNDTIMLPFSDYRSFSSSAGTRLGLLLAFLVVILAFLLASFPARNSDVWLHLARGRLLAQGASPATMPPDLAFDRLGNQTWLYDLFCYGCYQALGDAGLMFIKALLAAGMAFVLFRAGSVRDGKTSVAYASGSFGASLALLTMSPYLQLQPALVSCLFLALAFLLLHQPANAGRSPFWLLLLLLGIWANTDRWFVLGLGVVALAWLGEVLDAAETSGLQASASALLRRSLAFLVLAAACLVNPSHWHTFLWIFHPAASAAGSPFASTYFAKIGWGPASLAYFVLLGLSLLSFVAVLPHRRWQRFLLWLGLALLSTWQVRGIPFFAVVAGPVLAWNIQDFLARQRLRAGSVSNGPDPSLTLPARGGAALTALMVMILIICAWPGWLQAPPFGPRRWAFDLPPALERGATAVRRWHEEGKLAADRGGLHLSADTVYTFAWFCPAEKRLRLTTQGSAAQWRQRMRGEGIDYVVVYDTDRDRLSLILGGLVVDTEQWPLLYQEGDLAIFGWRDPDQASSADRFRSWQLDLNRLAFHPAPDKKAPAEAPDPQATRSWWDAFWKAAPPRSIDRDEALLHLLHAEALARLAPLQHRSHWENSQAAALIGAAGAWASPLALCDASLRIALVGPQASGDRLAATLQSRYVWQRDDAPPALYYLAVRAARRAVATNPEDAAAYLLLGESYLGLLHATRERAWGAQLRPLVQLRQAQASAALNRALALRPNFLQAHLHLARLYQEMGYLDLALAHGDSACRLARQAGPPAGVSPDEFQSSQAGKEAEVEQMAQRVQKRTDAAALASANSPTRQRAFVAFQNGLAEKALNILLESHLSAFGNEGMELELELLLGVGRPWDVQEWLRPEHKDKLGPLSYSWFRTRAAAACGDYARAEKECAEAAHALVQGPEDSQPLRWREKMALTFAMLVLNGQRGRDASFADLLLWHNQAMLVAQIQDQIQRLRQQADWTVLGGLLALEEGKTEEAKSAFRAALSLGKDKAAAATGGLDFNSRSLAQSYLHWLE